MLDLLNNAKLAKACAKRRAEKREHEEKVKTAAKIVRVRGVYYVRADLAPEAYKKAMRGE